MKNGDLIDRGVCSKPHSGCAKMHATDWMKDVVSNAVGGVWPQPPDADSPPDEASAGGQIELNL